MNLRFSTTAFWFVVFFMVFGAVVRTGSASGDDPMVTGVNSTKLWSSEAVPTALAFSPDGKRLAVAFDNKTIQLREAGTGKTLQSLKGLAIPAGSLAFSGDGKLLASAGTALTGDLKSHPDDPGQHPSSFELSIWNLAKEKVVHEAFDKEHRSTKDPERTIPFVALSHDGSLAVFPGRDRHTVVWNLVKNEVEHSFGGGLRPSAAAFSPDGKIVAVGTDHRAHGVVRTFDTLTGNSRNKVRTLYLGVTRLRFSPANDQLFVGYRGMVEAVSMKDSTSRTLWNAKLPLFLGDVVADFSADVGRTVLTFTDSAKTAEQVQVLVLDNASKKVLGRMEQVRLPIALSPDGKMLAGRTESGTTTVWAIE